MDKTMLLEELNVLNDLEQDINYQINTEIDKANAFAKELEHSWIDFVTESFPEEILNIIYRFKNNGKCISYKNEYDNSNDIYPQISVGNLHIGFYDKKFLIVSDDGKVVGFRYCKPGSCEYKREGLISWSYYPVTFWKYLRGGITFSGSVNGMKRVRKEIDQIYEFDKMLNDFKASLPEFYSEIARLNMEYISQKKQMLKTEEPEKPKKYVVKIEIEEI